MNAYSFMGMPCLMIIASNGHGVCTFTNWVRDLFVNKLSVISNQTPSLLGPTMGQRRDGFYRSKLFLFLIHLAVRTHISDWFVDYCLRDFFKVQ